MASIMMLFCIAFLTVLASHLSLGIQPGDCVDRFNRTIPERAAFEPVEDPCVICLCLKGKPEKCHTITCPTPLPNARCPYVVPSLVSCCAYGCQTIPSYENEESDEYDYYNENGMRDEYRI